MKILISILLLLLLGLFSVANATQPPSTYPQDTTVQIKVMGNCGQCKDRIENAAKIKGVSTATWDEDTKMLQLSYNPRIVNILQVHDAMAKIGHDTELKKASDRTYRKLPDCCHYRSSTDNLGKHFMIKGVVMTEDKKGNYQPLAGAVISIKDSKQMSVSDSLGLFNLPSESDSALLVVKFVGYSTDTLKATSLQPLTIILNNNGNLKEVILSSSHKSMYTSTSTTWKTLIVGEKELFRAACCNLSESFETNPSVDVAYNDALSGGKQIQMLGLSGIYTQLTVENMPGPRGLATATGLNFIPGTWIESIQLTKGTGSVVNGYESIAGQINIEQQKPDKKEDVYANIYINQIGKTDVNLNLYKKVSNHWSSALLLHDDFLTNKKVDMNKDGYRDLPYGNLFTVFQRWKYDNNKGWLGQIGVKYLKDDKTGGDIHFNPSTDKFASTHYGIGLATERYEGFGKLGYVFPRKKYKSIGLQLAAFSHQQDNYFGLTAYSGKQENFYGNLIYQSIIGTTIHTFKTGLSFLHDGYNEKVFNQSFSRSENVPGAFFEYTYKPNNQLSIVMGVRDDWHNMFGNCITPRLHLRYQPFKNTTIRLGGGSGFRTTNVFAENMGLLASARTWVLPTNHIQKSYGFEPEKAWNEGISIDQHIKWLDKDVLISLDYFRTDFIHQTVIDVDSSAHFVYAGNLKGVSYSNAFQINMECSPLKSLNVVMAYRWFDVQTTYHGKKMQKPILANNRAFGTINYTTDSKWKFDYTIQWIGTKRLPYLKDNVAANGFGKHSPSYFQMNAQVSKGWGRWDIYVGVENLTDFKQDALIIDGNHPFGKNFDASIVWANALGRMAYGGARWTF